MSLSIGETRVFTTKEFIELAPLGLVLHIPASGTRLYYKDGSYFVGDSIVKGCWSYFSVSEELNVTLEDLGLPANHTSRFNKVNPHREPRMLTVSVLPVNRKRR